MKKIYKMLVKAMGIGREYSQVPESSLAAYRMKGEEKMEIDPRAMAMIDAGVAP